MAATQTEPIVDLLELREVANLGLCAFAAKDIEAGQSVLTEVPFLDAPLKTKKFAAQEQKLVSGTAVEAGSGLIPESVTTIDVGMLDAFLASGKNLQQQVLSMPCNVDQDSPLVESVRKAVQILPHKIAAETAEKVLLIGRVNSYGIGNGRQALFARGRHITHACNPNCMFVAEIGAGKEGSQVVCGSFRARQKIAKGELLTTCHIDQDFASAHREQRRHYLLCQKGFLCSCKACAEEEDEFDRWPCPCCRPRDTDGHLAESQLAGCCALRAEGRSPPWKSQCGKTFTDAEVVVEGSRALASEALWSVYQPAADSKAATRNALLANVVRCFGEDHSVTQLLMRVSALRAVKSMQPLAPTAARLERCHVFLVSAGYPLGMMPLYSVYRALIARAQAEVKAKTPMTPAWFKLVTDATNCAYVVEGPDSDTARTGLVITRLMATLALQDMQQEE